jgi:rod shape-determining protein MreD
MSFQDARPLDPWRWLGAPTLLCIGATLLFALPLRVFGMQLPEPVFPLVPAFAWAMIRPSVLAPVMLLLMGLFLDLVWGGPIGLWPVSILTGYAGVLFCRSMMTGQSRPVLWSWFAVMTLLSISTGFIITTLDVGSTPSIMATFWQFLPTAMLFPFAYRLIDRFEDADVRFR